MNKSLYVKLAVFFLLISTIGSIVYLIVTNSMEKSKNISVMINKIAYERMLTEKITKKAIQYIILNDFRAKNRMEALMREFEDRFHRVKDEMINSKFLTSSEEIKTNMDFIEREWHSLKMDIDKFISGKEEPSLAIRQMEKKSDSLIIYLNKTIFLLEQEDQKSLRGLTLENILSLSFNIILILIIFVIWRLLVNLSINEKKYRILLHKSPLGIMIIKDRKFKFLNQYALQSLGFKNEKEIIGKSVLSFIHPNYHDLVLARFHTVLEQKLPVDIAEEEWINANGETITVEVLSIPFHFMGDHTNLTIFVDITEKKRSSHYFQELINIKEALEKSSIVEIIDEKGIIKYVNDKFCKISKYERSDVIGKSYQLTKSDFHTEQFYNELWDTLNQGKVWEGEIQNRAKDGTYYWVQTMVIPFINNIGQPYQFLIIKNDITDKKEAQKEIQELATKDHLTQLLNRRAFEENYRN
ncbi:PAS domain S-box protein [Calidifontibacillus erzurumensis]|uniref:PAS domain S-box protein n=1 Tax=Calidifontibacillus erzurumensis TaxID=2741433 RepID=UPI001E5842A0|nr:PAS domain S-box protein [Calidifontibacillus erzurumensis]